MTTPDRIYNLLPAIYRLRDQDVGEPLRQLLSVIEEQLEALEADIAKLYDDLFIETCDGPLIDYFAELVAVHLAPLEPSLIDKDNEAAAFISRRRQVVTVLATRAAKGTLTGLERIAREATGWPVRAVEQGVHLAVTQSVKWPNPERGRLLDTRDDTAMLTVGSAFAGVSALADVRRGNSSHTKPVGPHPTTVTVMLWRQNVTHIHRAPAAIVNDDNHYTFDALGYDQKLAVSPTPRRPGTPPAGDLDLPVEITRRQLRRNLTDYYGTDRSLCIYRGRSPVSAEQIVVADLSRWADDPDYGQVAVDPETGRIAFAVNQAPEEGVWVRYHRLDVGSVGAGAVRQSTVADNGSRYVRIFMVAAESTQDGIFTSVNAAVNAWFELSRSEGVGHGIVEILDSSVYEEDFDIRIAAGHRLDIRAAAGQRPVLRSVDEQHRPKRVLVEGYSGKDAPGLAQLYLAGITIAEHALELRGQFDAVALDHCTIVPEQQDADRRHIAVSVAAAPCALHITSSIIGGIRVNTPEVGYDPITLSITDSIVDAGSPGEHALSGSGDRPGYGKLTLIQSTVLGSINVFETALARDSIVTDTFYSLRRQTGEVRFCYLPARSHVPRRTGCEPDVVISRVQDDLKAGKIKPDEAESLLRTEQSRVRPLFDSTEFGTPDYCRLVLDTAPEITSGSEDDGELGVFHDLWTTRRIDDMTTRLAEFTPIGVDLDIMFAT